MNISRLTYLLAILLLCRCGGSPDETAQEPAAKETATNSELSSAAADPNNQGTTTEAPVADKTRLLPADTTTLQPGMVVVHCPKMMHEDNTYTAIATVGTLDLKEVMEEKLIHLINEDRQDNGEETVADITDLREQKIKLSHYVQVELEDRANKFTIHPVHHESKQTYDPDKAPLWMWDIVPKSNTDLHIEAVKLIFDIRVYDKNHNEIQHEREKIKVWVRIKGSWWQRVKGWIAIDEPIWPISAIILPLLTFILTRWYERRKKEK